MDKVKLDKRCKNCDLLIHKRGNVFCSKSCASTFNNKNRVSMSDEQKSKISIAVKKFVAENGPYFSREQLEHNGRKSSKNKHKEDPKSILDLSSRTVTKILARLNLGCSRCGWNEAVCDVHHIIFKKDGGTNAHNNLTYICPNCHRLVHTKKIDSSELISLDIYIGDRWKELYYG